MRLRGGGVDVFEAKRLGGVKNGNIGVDCRGFWYW